MLFIRLYTLERGTGNLWCHKSNNWRHRTLWVVLIHAKGMSYSCERSGGGSTSFSPQGVSEEGVGSLSAMLDLFYPRNTITIAWKAFTLKLQHCLPLWISAALHMEMISSARFKGTCRSLLCRSLFGPRFRGFKYSRKIIIYWHYYLMLPLNCIQEGCNKQHLLTPLGSKTVNYL